MSVQESLAASVADIRERGRRLAQLHLELLRSELKEKGRKVGTAAGLFLGAGLLALYAIGFALATIAVALALVVPWWLAMLIVTLALFLVVAIMILVGRGIVRKLQNAPPDKALAEAKVTADLFKANAGGTAARVRAGVKPGRAAPDVDAASDAGTAGAGAPVAAEVATPGGAAPQASAPPAGEAVPGAPPQGSAPPAAEPEQPDMGGRPSEPSSDTGVKDQ
jgi:hypothetical protein